MWELLGITINPGNKKCKESNTLKGNFQDLDRGGRLSSSTTFVNSEHREAVAISSSGSLPPG